MAYSNSPYIPTYALNPDFDPRRPATAPSPYVGAAMSPYTPLSPLPLSPWGSPYASPGGMTVQLPPQVSPGATVTILPPPAYPSPAFLHPPLPVAPQSHGWNEASVRSCIKDVDAKTKTLQADYDTLVGVLGSLDGAARMSAYADLKKIKDKLDKLKKKRAQYEPWRKMYPCLDLDGDDD
jgi:hypothetical protein